VSAGYLKKLLTDSNQILWNYRPSVKDESNRHFGLIRIRSVPVPGPDPGLFTDLKEILWNDRPSVKDQSIIFLD